MDKRRRTEVYSYIGARMSKSDWLMVSPSLSMLKLAVQLASEGHLRSVEEVWLKNIDLSASVKIEKLASIVTARVVIDNIMPTSLLDIILESVRCSGLSLCNMRLTEPQTRALVTALTKRLVTVTLDYSVTLDIQTLCKYKGQGKCQSLEVRYDTRRMYEERLRQWAAEVGWAVKADDFRGLTMTRKGFSESSYFTHYFQ